MTYHIQFSESVVKTLSKMDKQTVRIIKHWICKNLVDTVDPRLHGKALTGNLKGIWRYRIGDYRMFAEIHDAELIVFIFEIEHRSTIYKTK